jgi:hypothetical protein
VTPPPTQVEAVELVNRIEERKEVQFKLSSDAIKKLKSNWGRKVAKQQHKQCNEMAMKIAKMQKIRAKSANRMQKRVEERRSRRETTAQIKKGTAVMDSGAMSSVFRPEDDEYVIDTNVPSRKIFVMATGEKARASTIAKLKRNLRGVAGFGDKVPDLQNNSLVSTSKLADENYSTLFTPTEVLVFDGKVDIDPKRMPVWKGWRCKETGLWRVPLIEQVTNVNTQTRLLTEEEMRQSVEEGALSVYNLPSKAEAVRYLHAALGFPTKETMLAAARAGFLTSWPGLNVTAIHKHFPESIETQKGHMKHQRQGVRSTKIPIIQADVTEEDRLAIEQEMKALKQKQRDIYIKIWEEKELVYSDQTGKFPTTSSRGNKYLMVLYYIDGSYIMMEPMKLRHENEMIRAHNVLIERLKSRGFYPKKQLLDNEISKA